MVQRRPHRDGVGVVGVVDQDGVLRELHQLPTKAREDYPRRQIGHPVQRISERDARRDRRQGVVEVVRLGEGKAEALLAGRGADQGMRSLPSSIVTSTASTSPPAPKRSSLCARPRCGSSAPGSRGHDGGPARAEPVDDLRLGRGDRLDRAQQLDVDRADVGDHATSGSAIAQSSAIWPGPRIAISSTRTSVSSGRAEHGERHADLGVVVLGAGVDLTGKERPADVLDGGLAGRAR